MQKPYVSLRPINWQLFSYHSVAPTVVRMMTPNLKFNQSYFGESNVLMFSAEAPSYLIGLEDDKTKG